MAFSKKARARNLMPRWPRDWEPRSAYLLRKHPGGPPSPGLGSALLEAVKSLPSWLYWGTQRLSWAREGGYIAARSGAEMAGTGAIRLGKLYPRNALERLWPMEVWVPRSEIYRHIGINGPTGAGKTTTVGYAVPFYAALAGQSVFMNDVKSTEFFAWFVDWFRKNGGHAINLAPWTPSESLATEPLWSATREELDIIVDAIIASAKGKGGDSGGGNADFFNKASKALFTSIVIAMTYLPRRYCTLPHLYRILAGGDKPTAEMLMWIEKSYPTLETTMAAAERLVVAAEGELEREWEDEAGTRHPRAEDVQAALQVIDRSGYPVAAWVRETRQALWTPEAEARGTIDRTGPAWAQRTADLRARYEARRRAWEVMLFEIRTVINQPDQTFQNIVMGAANALSFFRSPELQRFFSRPEFDIHDLVKRPTFCVVGTMQAKKEVGAKFIGNLFGTLALNLSYERSRVPGFDPAKAIDVILLLDEMPQLGLYELPNILATVRSYKVATVSIWQSDGQLKELWNENYTTVLDNHLHQLMLYGSDGLSAKRAVERIGKATLMKESKSRNRGSGPNSASYGSSESAERVERMTEPDVTNVMLNGRSAGKNAAIYVGKATPAFILDQIPFWDDPFLVRELGCVQRGERWVPPENRNPFPRLPLFEVEPAPPGGTQSWVPRLDARGERIEDKHATDPLRDTVDFIAPPESPVYYELTDLIWEPEDIGVSPGSAAELMEILDKKRGGAGTAPQAPAPQTPKAQAVAIKAQADQVGIARPAKLPWLLAMTQADSGCPCTGVLPFAQWEERRFGWREAADAVSEARSAQRGCRPRPLTPKPLNGAIDLDWFLVQGFHHAIDYPSWAFMWMTQAAVAPPEPEAVRQLLVNALTVVDTCFGGVAAPEALFGPWSASDDTTPAALRDITARHLETARDRVADARGGELAMVWAESRAALYELVPKDLSPASSPAVTHRLVLAELLLDYAAYSRALHLDLAAFASPDGLSPDEWAKAFDRSGYAMWAKNALVEEMKGMKAFTEAMQRIGRRSEGMQRLEAAVRAHGTEAEIAALLGVAGAAAAA